MKILLKFILPLVITNSVTFLHTTSMANSSSSDVVNVAEFSIMDLNGWKRKAFKDETEYSLVEKDKTTYMQAKSTMSASALYKKLKVDLNMTPYLN